LVFTYGLFEEESRRMFWVDSFLDEDCKEGTLGMREGLCYMRQRFVLR